MRFALILLIAGLTTSFAYAGTKVQIIHTNDLHSYLAGHADGRGGYARVKTKMDELKAQALEQGIESIVLDAGDFGEGTSFFYIDEGVTSFRALNLLGIDAAVIGNHDHMMGTETLAQQIKKSRVGFENPTRILSANLAFTPEQHLKDLVVGSVFVRKSGLKINVIGLSTPEAHFQYPLLPGFMRPVDKVLPDMEKKAREKESDLVIALTHLGVDADKKMVKDSREVDLVIGGHSHTRLEEEIYQRNKDNRDIPIVQTGAHGLAVGSLIVEVHGDKDVEVVDYQLHDIDDRIESNPFVEQYVLDAIERRDQLFDNKWNDVIGYSDVDLTGYKNGESVHENTCWGNHMARMTLESIDADLGIHLAHFGGMHKEAGPITYGDIVDNFPHFREYGDKGWKVASFEVSGKNLKYVIKALISIDGQFGINLGNISYKKTIIPKFIPFIGGKTYIRKVRIGGEKVDKKQKYKIAFPYEVGHALKVLMGEKVRKILPKFTEHEIYYWDIMEDYVSRNSPINCD